MAANFKSCLVDGCNLNADRSARGGRGWCQNHYGRWLRHGNPVGGRTSTGVAIAWLKENTNFSGDECLTWPFAKYPDGYGAIKLSNRRSPMRASRAMCELVHGAPPSLKHEAAHSCGKGHLGCVNPNHVRWATHAENEADKLDHGTSRHGKNPVAKLSEDDVREIRILLRSTHQADIAQRFGIKQQTVSDIKMARRWAWL